MKKPVSIKHQAGFTFGELAIALAVISILTVAFVEFQSDRFREQSVDASSRGFSTLAQASAGFYADTGAWPTNVAALLTAQNLTGFNNRNAFGNPYLFTITPPTVASPRPSLTISSDLASIDAARSVQQQFGSTAQLTGNVVSLTVAVPGTEISHDGLLDRFGVRPMEATLRMEGAGSNINMFDNEIFNTSRITVSQPDNSGLVQADNIDAGAITAQTFVYTN